MPSNSSINPAINPDIFKAYDIRGIVGTDLTPATAKLIGLSIGSASIAQGERNIVVGRDGRLSGLALMAGLKAGLKQSGCHLMDIGMVPTPVVSFAAHTKVATSAVMITGSHNPPEYNGFKVMIAGKTLSGAEIQALCQRIQTQNFSFGAGTGAQIDIAQDYIDTIAANIRLNKNKPLHIVVDCGNGVAGNIAPQLFERLGVRVDKLFCLVDGNFPNHHPDPSNPKNLEALIQEVRATGADLGLAFDGDGDRLGLIDNQGAIIWADRQLMLYARDVLSRHSGAGIVFDVKCTSLLAKDIEKHGGKAIMSRTGHSFIKAKLAETGAMLGGEMSGHIFFKERWYGFDDALYTGARLLEILSNTTQTCAEVFQQLPNQLNTPEINIPFSKQGVQFSAMDRLLGVLKQDLASDLAGDLKNDASGAFADANITTIDGVRLDYPTGWGLVRPSNTTPCLVLRFEAENAVELERIQTVFRQWLGRADIPTDVF